MKARDITLSSSLIGLYIAVNLLCSITPIEISSWMYSALFGLFWNYFSLKQNLTFQGIRIAWVMITSIIHVPKLIAMMRVNSVIGVAFTKWSIINPTALENSTITILETVGKAQPTIAVYVFVFIYVALNCLTLPYIFYRYYRWTGVFKRMPEF
jgi:hypothetical protein